MERKKNEKKKKILFIEDEPDQVMMVRLRLEKNGYEVLSENEGQAGFERAFKELPDLILLDIVMPGINGFEVCKLLKKDPKTRGIPVIATTAAGYDDIEQLCLSAGADGCVRKPYDSTDLLHKIRRLLPGGK